MIAIHNIMSPVSMTGVAIERWREPVTFAAVEAPHPDLHLRYWRISRRLSPGSTVLDVGSRAFVLQELLPECAVTSLDVGPAPEVPPGADFRREDFLTSGMASDSFDVVVAVDVLEHVPPRERPRFLEQAARVASRELYVAFPAGELAGAVEAILRRSLAHVAYRQALYEHALLGLPGVAEVERWLRELGLDPTSEPLTTVWEWLASFLFTSPAEEPDGLPAEYRELLARHATPEPGPGSTYRYLVRARTG